MIVKVCEFCESEFSTRYSFQRFCTDRCRQRGWGRKNKEQLSVYRKAYYQKNKEQERQAHKKYYQEHRESISQKQLIRLKEYLREIYDLVEQGVSRDTDAFKVFAYLNAHSNSTRNDVKLHFLEMSKSSVEWLYTYWNKITLEKYEKEN